MRWKGFLLAAFLSAPVWAAPTINIQWPVNGQNLSGGGSGGFPITGLCSTNTGSITSIVGSTDGVHFAAVTGLGPQWFYEVYRYELPLGVSTVTIVATDSDNNVSTATVWVNVINNNPACNHSQVGTSGIYCEQGIYATTQDGHTLANATWPNGHTAGDVIFIFGGSSSTDYPSYCTDVSNTLGYTWRTVTVESSGAGDGDLSQAALCYAYVPETTSATDTIYSILPPNGSGLDGTGTYFEAVEYSGVGSREGSYGKVSSYGAVPEGMTGAFDSQPNDLCLAQGGGAPMYALTPIWTEAYEDGIRPYGIIFNMISTGTTCSLDWAASFQDGSGSGGFSLRPKFNSNYSGQSINLGGQEAYNSSVPMEATNRVEFMFHDVDVSGPSYGYYIPLVQSGYGTGWDAYLTVNSTNSVTLTVYNLWNTIPSNSICANPFSYDVGSLQDQSAYVRMQEDPIHGMQDIEVFDQDGNRLAYNQCPYTSASPSGSGFVVGTGGSRNVDMAFVRVSTNVVPMNSRTPTTVDDANRVVEWKFDGNANDSSGNGYTATLTAGATYYPTPFQEVVSDIRTTGWGPLIKIPTQRAGYPLGLDGSQSFSQGDNSNAVNCIWSEINGPSTLTIVSPTSCQTTATGSIYGDYLMRLTVTDQAGVSTYSQEHIGVVAMDNNDVVVSSNPLVNRLFGNMIAYGHNPWGFADYWDQAAFAQRAGQLPISADLQGFTYDLLTCGPLTAHPYTCYFLAPNPQPYGGDYENLGWIFGGGGTIMKPMWEVPGRGSVSYSWNGGGWSIGNTNIKTTLTTSISSTTMSIVIGDASKLDFSEVPTRIILYSVATAAQEEIRISTVSATSGAATMTVAYDGRGQIPLAWPNTADTIVTQDKVTGSGTEFIQDHWNPPTTPYNPLCPVGPGLPGVPSAQYGTISIAPGTTTVYGTNTGWDLNTMSVNGFKPYLQVNATHGGQPFLFIAKISTVTDSTQVMTLMRPYPADADTLTDVQYDVMPAVRTIDLRFPNQFTAMADTQQYDQSGWATTGCESNTSAYLNTKLGGNPGQCGVEPYDSVLGCNSYAYGHDVPALDGSVQSGYSYSSVENKYNFLNGGATGGINFYGESIAMRARCLRSGLAFTCTMADLMDNYWPSAPFVNPPVTTGLALYLFAGGISGFMSKLTNPNSLVTWQTLRNYAAQGEAAANSFASNCNQSTRDIGGQLTWLILAAEYDPSTTSGDCGNAGGCRGRWIADLATMQAADETCKQSDNSWANNNIWNNNQFTGGGAAGPAITLTNGSVTGYVPTGIPSGLCTGVAIGSGTIAVSTGGFVVTGSTAVPTPTLAAPYTEIVLTGTKGGTTYVTPFQYSGSGGSGSTITLSGIWPGDAGNITWMALSVPGYVPPGGNGSGAMTAFGKDITDVALTTNYSCYQVNADTFTLTEPFQGTTSALYYGWNFFPVNGYGQQPFMLGIKSYGMGQLAAWNLDSNLTTYPTTYVTLNQGATQWLHDKGLDSATLSTNYGRDFSYCEPTILPNGVFDTRTPGCSTGRTIAGQSLGREQNQELSDAISDFYQYYGGLTNQAFGDDFYNAVWGHVLYNASGLPSVDGNTTAMNAPQTNLAITGSSGVNQGKWYGFFGGVGKLFRWPAERLGGVLPPQISTATVAFSLSSYPTSTHVKMTLTEPSGYMLSPVTCTVTPCSVTGDARQGAHLVETDYLDGSNALIGSTFGQVNFNAPVPNTGIVIFNGAMKFLGKLLLL